MMEIKSYWIKIFGRPVQKGRTDNTVPIFEGVCR